MNSSFSVTMHSFLAQHVSHLLHSESAPCSSEMTFRKFTGNYYFSTHSQLALSSSSLNYKLEQGRASKSEYLSSDQDFRTTSCVVLDSFVNLLLLDFMCNVNIIKDLHNRVVLESKLER